MSTSQELVSVLRERFYQSEERVDFQKTFMNFTRDQTCREAKMTVMTLRQVVGVYLEIRPNDSKFKLIPEVISILGFTDRNQRVDCQQVVDHVMGKHLETSECRSSAGADRSKRGSTGKVQLFRAKFETCVYFIVFQKSSCTTSARRDSIRSNNSSTAGGGVAYVHESRSSTNSAARITGSKAGRTTYTRESAINSCGSGAVTSCKSAPSNDSDDLERQYRMAVIDLQVARYKFQND